MKTKWTFGIDAEGYRYQKQNNIRVTQCCNAPATYHDSILCCKVCYQEVDQQLAFLPTFKTN